MSEETEENLAHGQAEGRDQADGRDQTEGRDQTDGRDSKPRHRVKPLVIAFVVGVVLGAVGLFFFQHYSPLNTTAAPTPSVVFERIVAQDELVAVSQSYNITDKEEGDPSTFFNLFNIPFTENSFWYRYVGMLKAGVNLKEAEFSQEGNTIVVSLSAPYIISNTPDMDKSGVLEENNNILNMIHVEKVDEFQKQCQQKSEEDAIEGGLLDEAKTQSERDITELFTAALDDAYTIKFEWR